MRGSQHSVVVNDPIGIVYGEWTRLEKFARFMEPGESVVQVDATHHHWVVNVAGVIREFDTEIVDQVPYQLITWQSAAGPLHAGMMTFHQLDEDWTRILLCTTQADEGSHLVEPEVSIHTGMLDRFLHAYAAESRERHRADRPDRFVRGRRAGRRGGSIPKRR